MALLQPPLVPPHPTQVKVGRVVSDKMEKTVLVEVNLFRRHPLYGQVQRRRKRYMVHDEANTAHVGEQVRFCLCRPISRHKRWILMDITRPARGAAGLAQEENTTTFRAEAPDTADATGAAEEASE